jgi:hypothetical protein
MQRPAAAAAAAVAADTKIITFRGDEMSSRHPPVIKVSVSIAASRNKPTKSMLVGEFRY